MFDLEIVCRGPLKGIFTGFDDPRPVVVEFENGRLWRQCHPFYFYYGMCPRPEALVVDYFGAFYLFVNAVSEEWVGNERLAAPPIEVVEITRDEAFGELLDEPDVGDTN